ncbi:hypothetical protein [Nocardia huaxiensis]|uniref:DUF8017 domain-containing protein n=1 Tax=Nocardia huaxiensis TaxID=2755382 RepID=A0A7D6V9X0_9NOCA|nr:hypothetical protein [Nocardia huaxiensis]QLY31352.1 hypothetical protein H0264_03030 [Nocardia huaxiensis]UFS94895.1 hypothetical protein LPY97_29865 [Nocardia huaxiensis]
MTGGSDDRNNDPERGDANPDWWQGMPPPGSPWESHPQHPVQPNPAPGGQYPQQGPSPFQSGPQPQGTTPFQSGANPFRSGPNPYPTGPLPQAGRHPYQTGQNPSQSGQPPYGGTPAYGGYGQPPSDERRKLWLYSGIGALVIAIVAVVATVVVMTDDSGGGGGQASGTSTVSSTTTSRTTSRTTTPNSTTRTSTPAAVIPGYQVVAPSDIDSAWDVPADWTLDTSTTTLGAGADELSVTGLAQEGIGYCPDFVRTTMFLTVSTEADAAAAATEAGARMARTGYQNATVQASSPEPFANSDKSLNGVYVETSGTYPPPAANCASAYTVYTFAVSGGSSGSLVLTLAADTGVDRAVGRDLARRILATFRFI